MGALQTRLAVASRTVNGGRSFQLLNRQDSQRLEAFFLAMTFDQRRCCFGGGMSDEAVIAYCRGLDWRRTIVVARMGPCCPEAIAMVCRFDDGTGDAELALACPLDCDRPAIIRTLVNLAIDAASPFCRRLIVQREFAPPDLVGVLRELSVVNDAAGDIVVKLG